MKEVNNKNNSGVIILLIVIIGILAILCIMFATGIINFNMNKVNGSFINVSENENIIDNNKDDNSIVNSNNQNVILDNDYDTSNKESYLLALGLSMLKIAKESNGFFQSSNNPNEEGLIYNYGEVANFFTKEFTRKLETEGATHYHICWPIKRDNNYYVNFNCGFGGPISYAYKSIKISNYTDTKIDYIITYEQHLMTEDKYGDIESNFQLVLEDNMWKINYYYNYPY